MFKSYLSQIVIWMIPTRHSAVPHIWFNWNYTKKFSCFGETHLTLRSAYLLILTKMRVYLVSSKTPNVTLGENECQEGVKLNLYIKMLVWVFIPKVIVTIRPANSDKCFLQALYWEKWFLKKKLIFFGPKTFVVKLFFFFWLRPRRSPISLNVCLYVCLSVSMSELFKSDFTVQYLSSWSSDWAEIWHTYQP